MRRSRVVPAVLLGAVVVFEAFGYAQRLGLSTGRPGAGDAVEARARDLDERFVETLIIRYRDTLALAEEESRAGRDPELRRLATSLLETRRRDLAHLMARRTADRTPPPAGAVK